MKPNRRETISLLAGAAPAALGALTAAGMTSPGNAQEVKSTGPNPLQKIETRIGTLDFTHDFANGYPSDATVEKLYDERDFQRGCQAYLWSLPASRSRRGSAALRKDSAPGTDRSSPSCPSKRGAAS